MSELTKEQLLEYAKKQKVKIKKLESRCAEFDNVTEELIARKKEIEELKSRIENPETGPTPVDQKDSIMLLESNLAEVMERLREEQTTAALLRAQIQDMDAKSSSVKDDKGSPGLCADCMALQESMQKTNLELHKVSETCGKYKTMVKNKMREIESLNARLTGLDNDNKKLLEEVRAVLRIPLGEDASLADAVRQLLTDQSEDIPQDSPQTTGSKENEIDELRRDLECQVEESMRLQHQITDLQAQQASTENHWRDLVTSLRMDNDASQAQHDREREESAEAVRDGVSALQRTLEQSTRRLADSEAALVEKESCHNLLQSKYDEMLTERDELISQVAELQSRLTQSGIELAASVSELTTKDRQHEVTVSRMNHDVEEWQAVVASLESKTTETMADKSRLISEKDDMQRTIDDLQKQIQILTCDFAVAQREVITRLEVSNSTPLENLPSSGKDHPPSEAVSVCSSGTGGTHEDSNASTNASSKATSLTTSKKPKKKNRKASKAASESIIKEDTNASHLHVLPASKRTPGASNRDEELELESQLESLREELRTSEARSALVPAHSWPHLYEASKVTVTSIRIGGSTPTVKKSRGCTARARARQSTTKARSKSSPIRPPRTRSSAAAVRASATPSAASSRPDS